MTITSTIPGLAPPVDYRIQRITLSDLQIGEVITAEFTEASIPGDNLSYTIASTNVATATAGLLAAIEAHAAEGVAGGWAWVEVTVNDGTTYLDVISLDADGELLFTSTPPEGGGGGGPVVTKIWTGNSVARAQVTTLTPLNVLTGDTFSVKINGKAISVVATADTAANVATLLAAAINATQIPEWREVTATASGDVVTLTARTAGVPFTVTAGSTDAVGIEITTTTAGSAGTNALQSFAVPKSAAGTFEITFGDQTVTGMAIGASATTVRSAFEALSTVGAGNVAVTKADSADGNDDVYTLTFQGSLAKTPVAEVIVDLKSTKPLIRTIQQGGHSGTVQNEKQTIEVGSAGTVGEYFTLTLDAQTTGHILSPTTFTEDISSAISSAIGALSNVRQVSVTKSSSAQLYTVEWVDYEGSAQQSQLTASLYSSGVPKTHRLTITNTAGVLAVNEVQKVAIQGTASGGTFTLTYSGQTTSSIAYNASTSTVASALEALSNIGVGDVAVTGSAGAWIVTFQGALAGTNVLQLTATSSLTGTAAANVTVATTTTSQGPNHYDTPDNWMPVGVPTTGDHVIIDLAAPNILYGLDQTGVTLASLRVSMSWAGGRLGLPRYNEGGYIEWRTRELTCGITTIVIGDGEGSGPTKIALNTLTAQTALTLLNCGGSSERDVPCVTWRGTHADNVIEVHGGDFGSAWWSDETAQISTLRQRGGTTFLKNTTIDDEFDARSQTARALRCTLGGKPFNL